VWIWVKYRVCLHGMVLS